MLPLLLHHFFNFLYLQKWFRIRPEIGHHFTHIHTWFVHASIERILIRYDTATDTIGIVFVVCIMNNWSTTFGFLLVLTIQLFRTTI